MNTWRTLLPHELDEIEMLTRSMPSDQSPTIKRDTLLALVAAARRDLGADEELERQRKAAYTRGFEAAYVPGEYEGA